MAHLRRHPASTTSAPTPTGAASPRCAPTSPASSASPSAGPLDRRCRSSRGGSSRRGSAASSGTATSPTRCARFFENGGRRLLGRARGRRDAATAAAGACSRRDAGGRAGLAHRGVEPGRLGQRPRRCGSRETQRVADAAAVASRRDGVALRVDSLAGFARGTLVRLRQGRRSSDRVVASSSSVDAAAASALDPAGVRTPVDRGCRRSPATLRSTSRASTTRSRCAQSAALVARLRRTCRSCPSIRATARACSRRSSTRPVPQRRPGVRRARSAPPLAATRSGRRCRSRSRSSRRIRERAATASPRPLDCSRPGGDRIAARRRRRRPGRARASRLHRRSCPPLRRRRGARCASGAGSRALERGRRDRAGRGARHPHPARGRSASQPPPPPCVPDPCLPPPPPADAAAAPARRRAAAALLRRRGLPRAGGAGRALRAAARPHRAARPARSTRRATAPGHRRDARLARRFDSTYAALYCPWLASSTRCARAARRQRCGDPAVRPRRRADRAHRPARRRAQGARQRAAAELGAGRRRSPSTTRATACSTARHQRHPRAARPRPARLGARTRLAATPTGASSTCAGCC